MKFFEKSGGGKTQSPEQAADQEAFARRDALRRGGPEADRIRQEDREKNAAQARQEDTERNAKFLKEWPRERLRQQKAIEETEKLDQEYERKIKEAEASWRKNEDRQFAQQSRTLSKGPQDPYGEQERALRDLRQLRDMDANTLEAYREERKKLGQNLNKLKSDLENGDKRFAAMQG